MSGGARYSYRYEMGARENVDERRGKEDRGWVRKNVVREGLRERDKEKRMVSSVIVHFQCVCIGKTELCMIWIFSGLKHLLSPMQRENGNKVED